MASPDKTRIAPFYGSHFPRNLLTFKVLTFHVSGTALCLRGVVAFSQGEGASCQTHQKVALSFARTVWITGAVAGARPS